MNSIRQFCRRHLICILCTAAGLFAGLYGVAAGFAAGAFAEIILFRFSEEKKYRMIIEKGSSAPVEREPFPGALYLCALAVYCLDDSTVASRQARLVLEKIHHGDWSTLCRAAGSALKSAGLNGDLLTECEAGCILHALSANKNSVPLKQIFQLLQICEFAWDEKARGRRPSLYLEELLNYTCVSNELESAYAVLGLTDKATLAQVKSAHRKLAAKYHPDTDKTTVQTDDNAGKQQHAAAEKQAGTVSEFMRIQSAYELISKNRQ